MPDREYDMPKTDFAAASREASGWTAIVIAVMAAVVIAVFALGLYYYQVVRPAEIAATRTQDIESRQNLAGQTTAVQQYISDYNEQQSALTRLQAQPQSANRDQQVQNAAAAMRQDVIAAHDATNNLPSVSVLPQSQQEWLAAHPRP